MQELFFDTYAIVEIIRGNQNYAKYLDCQIIINEFVLAELYYSLLKDYGEKFATEQAKKYSDFSINPNFETIKQAMDFRNNNREKKLSMTDCISYIQAKNLGIKFLTGDKEFEKMDNVEFVK